MRVSVIEGNVYVYDRVLGGNYVDKIKSYLTWVRSRSGVSVTNVYIDVEHEDSCELSDKRRCNCDPDLSLGGHITRAEGGL